jgi:hypothetical protein
MFDLNDKASTRIIEAESPVPAAPEGQQERPGDPLDSTEAVATFDRLQDHYRRELSRQEENRTEQARDEDFYDNEQWSDTDKAALADRGQSPLVYNVIATTVDWVLGTEKRGRTDHKILPRRKEDAKPAERKGQLLKYLSDCNRTPFSRSRAFADGVKVGVGWMEDAFDDGDGQEPLVSRYESWRNMLFDSAAQKEDLEDGRYIFRSKWVDYDLASAIFPNRIGILDRAARDTDYLLDMDDYGDEAMDAAEREMERVNVSSGRNIHGYQRRRLRIVEAWFKTPAKVARMHGGMFSGELFDPRSRGHLSEIDKGEGEQREGLSMRVHCALMTTAGLLWLGPSPYRHNRYPFTPVWGKRRGRDGMPYGLIRGLRGINEDINKRASKALNLFTTKRVIADEGAVEDHDEAADEVARPDAYIVKKPGLEFRVETDSDLAQGHIELMSRDIAMIQQVGGVTDENQGRQTNATSKVAIEKRQLQGAVATTGYFDNLRLAEQIRGEKLICNIEQFVDEKKAFRITNMRGKPEYIQVNDGLPENDIAASKADFVISEADWRASMREAAAAELFDLLSKLAPVNPELVVVMLDLMVEQMDISNREEIVRRIRQVTGMRDPDAEEPTPEELAKAEQAAKDQQLQRAGLEATVRKTVADAVKSEAQGQQAISTAVKNIIAAIGGPKRGAIDIAADVMGGPQVAGPADEILKDAGYVSRTEKEFAAETAAAAQQQAEQAQQQPQAQLALPAPGQQDQQQPARDSEPPGITPRGPR